MKQDIVINLFIPGWASALCPFIEIHQTAEVNCKLQQHRQDSVQVEDVR